MDAERVGAQLDRILASAAFADAERAIRFLRFVVGCALEGRTDEIKESVIAIEVLGRNSSFDSKSDPIVRVEAGRLRDRLNSYYEGEGRADRTLICIPKGGYVPEFSERPPSPSATQVDVLRLSILPPENSSFESFVISPDGRKLAFTAALRGRMMLWVRALDSLEAKPLPATDNASYPFWSPDSRAIGFFVPGKLRAIDVTGGPARDVADGVAGRGGTWSPNGIIVFCPRPIGILYQVAASGGVPKPVTSLDHSRREVAHSFPQFLPDGRHFLYLAASFARGESSIRLGSLDSVASKVLLSADAGAGYAPLLGGTGCLFFPCDGALIVQPFDPRRLELSGERTVVVPEVRYRRWQHPSFSVSNTGVLLYQGGRAESQQLSWFDRQGKLLAEVGPRNDYAAFSLSPNENSVAIQRIDDPDTGFPTIWMMDLRRDGAVFRFTEPDLEHAEFSPVWSPDGSEIVYSRGNDQRMRLLRQASTGGHPTCVLDTEGPKFVTDWSSDRRYVTYGSQWPDYRHMHTWIVSFGDSGQREKPRPFLQHSCTELSAYFAPAEATGSGPPCIAYASNETGCYEVYVRDFPDGSHKWQVSSQGGFLPHWRSDGRELFYLAPAGMLMSVAVCLGTTFGFGTPQPLFETGHERMSYSFWMNQYAVGRNGQRFLLNRRLSQATSNSITAVIPR